MAAKGRSAILISHSWLRVLVSLSYQSGGVFSLWGVWVGTWSKKITGGTVKVARRLVTGLAGAPVVECLEIFKFQISIRMAMGHGGRRHGTRVTKEKWVQNFSLEQGDFGRWVW